MKHRSRIAVMAMILLSALWLLTVSTSCDGNRTEADTSAVDTTDGSDTETTPETLGNANMPGGTVPGGTNPSETIPTITLPRDEF